MAFPRDHVQTGQCNIGRCVYLTLFPGVGTVLTHILYLGTECGVETEWVESLPELVYKWNYLVFIAFGLMAIRVVAIIWLSWGSYAREVSLSPIETANALGPTVHDPQLDNRGMGIKKLLDKLGDKKVL
jgi:hypothetical protein